MFNKNLLMYLLFCILVFSILKLLPNNKLNQTDMILISIITVTVCICLRRTMVNNETSEHFLGFLFETESTNKNIKSSNSRKTKVEQAKRILESEKKRIEKQIQRQKPSDKKVIDKKATDKKLSNKSPSLPNRTYKPLLDVSKMKEVKDDKSKKSNKVSTQVSVKQIVKPTLSVEPKIAAIQKKLDVEKKDVPFTKLEMENTLFDIKNAGSDHKLASKIVEKSKNDEYYELLVVVLQTNMESAYKLIKRNHNKINKLILDLKLKRMESFMQNMKNIEMMTNDNKKPGKTESRELSNTMQKYLNTMIKQGKYIDDNGFVQNMVDNDMKYTQYTPKEQEKLGTYDATFTNKWNNDYALLNTDKWRPPIGHQMYKCKQEVKCPVCPSLTAGYPVALKEFDNARKILQPDNINVDFINEKLITGLA
jgi:hypothetical protein